MRVGGCVFTRNSFLMGCARWQGGLHCCLRPYLHCSFLQDYISPNSDTNDVLTQLADVHKEITVIEEKVETYAEYQRLFEIPVSEWTNLRDIQNRYKQRYDIWSTLDRCVLVAVSGLSDLLSEEA